MRRFGTHGPPRLCGDSETVYSFRAHSGKHALRADSRTAAVTGEGCHMPYRPPLAGHPRAAVVVSLLAPLAIFGYVAPRISGAPPHWPWVTAESLMIAGITYLARTRSGRFLGAFVIAVSLAALMLYGVVTYTHGMPHDTSERTYWALVVALPVVGLALGGRILRQAPTRRSV